MKALAGKLYLHFADKYIATQMQGAKVGADLVGDSENMAIRTVGVLGGLVVGSVVGIVRFWNPMDMADSFLTPPEELNERVEKKMKAVE